MSIHLRFRLWFIVAVTASFLSGPAFSEETVMVGMLENLKDDYAGSPKYHAIRVLFRKDANEWIPFKNDCNNTDCLTAITKEFPAEVKWTIAWDGKNLGELTSRTPSSFKYYSHLGHQVLPSDAKVPTIGKPTKEFSGESSHTVLRPLVAVSKPFFKDPEKWQPSLSIDKALLAKLKADFREKHPMCECREFDDGEPPCKPVKYTDAQIALGKHYGSNQQGKIVKLSLKCAERFAVPDESYAVSAKGQSIPLGKDLILVDAGDYDGDGRSEVIFSRAAHNRGEYVIYYDEFSKKAVFGWGYH